MGSGQNGQNAQRLAREEFRQELAIMAEKIALEKTLKPAMKMSNARHLNPLMGSGQIGQRAQRHATEEPKQEVARILPLKMAAKNALGTTSKSVIRMSNAHLLFQFVLKERTKYVTGLKIVQMAQMKMKSCVRKKVVLLMNFGVLLVIVSL